MDNGWIKLHRKLIDWQWYGVINVRVTFIHLLLIANHESKFVYGNKVERGQILTSLDRLSSEICISVKELRNALLKLEKTGEIIKKGANKFTIITICNYDSYQCFEECEWQTKGKQRANKGQTRGKQRATNNNDKNVKNDKNINLGENEFSQPKKTKEERAKEFALRIAEYKEQYDRDMLIEFYNYWTESNDGDNAKMRFEKEKTFGISRRLSNWERIYLQKNKAYGNTDATSGNKKKVGRFEVGIRDNSEFEGNF